MGLFRLMADPKSADLYETISHGDIEFQSIRDNNKNTCAFLHNRKKEFDIRNRRFIQCQRIPDPFEARTKEYRKGKENFKRSFNQIEKMY